MTRRHLLAIAGGAASAAIGCSPTSDTAKSKIQQLVNPFGDPWARRNRRNDSINIASSSALGFFSRAPFDRLGRLAADGTPAMKPEFVRYHRFFSSPYHYDESIAKLMPDMPRYRPVKAAFKAADLVKKFIGYVTVNFVENPGMPGYAEADESFFVHRPGTAPAAENRVKFADSGALQSGGPVFDIRNPAYHAYIAEKITEAMVHNDLDGVLIDYAASQFPFGTRFKEQLPGDWFEKFDDHQIALLKTISDKAGKVDRMVFCNGVSVDGLYVTDVVKIRRYLDACHGIFWEQPFRTGWLDHGNGPDEYYERLDTFFDLANEVNKPMIINQGTYRFHGTEEDNLGWHWRFQKTSAEKERRILNYLLPFYLLYTKGRLTPMIYTHPTKLLDIYASEAYFREFDTDIGTPEGRRRKVDDHVHMRVFSKAVVVVNSRNSAFTGVLTLQDGLRESLSITLEARQGQIIPRRSDDTFETEPRNLAERRAVRFHRR